MKMTIDTAKVANCSVDGCAYSQLGSYRARAITVGDLIRPVYGSFFSSVSRWNETKRVARVDACKVTNCLHNKDCECNA